MSYGKVINQTLNIWECGGASPKWCYSIQRKKKIGSKTFDCLFIGYVEHSAAYRFLVLKSDMIECDTIMETRNAKFFEDVFPLKYRASFSIVSSLEQLVETYSEPISEDLRRNKRHKTEKYNKNKKEEYS